MLQDDGDHETAAPADVRYYYHLESGYFYELADDQD
jgi:hypothetical protein